MYGLGDLPKSDGSCVFELLLGPKCVLVAAVPAIRAMTGSRPLDARSRCYLEVTETLFDWAFAAKVAVLVGLDGDAHLIAERVEISSVETAHCIIHAVPRENVNGGPEYRSRRQTQTLGRDLSGELRVASTCFVLCAIGVTIRGSQDVAFVPKLGQYFIGEQKAKQWESHTDLS